MYEEKKRVINWKKLFIKVFLIMLVLFLLFLIIPFGKRKEANGHTVIFNRNYVMYKDVANKYFTKNNLPKDNDEIKVTLSQLIRSKKIETLKSSDNKVCDENNSYIKVYKKNIGYELEVYLSCGDENEISHIYLGCFDECQTPTTPTTTTEKPTTTKKVKNNSKTTTTITTTKTIKYAVIFNENGGTKVSRQSIIQGNTAKKPQDPTKDGFIFIGWYLDNEIYDFTTPVNSNIILIAKWEIDYNN